jgi:putative ABC transport system substrate-binding protein
VKRREFIAAFGSMVARPVVARAQQPERMRRIGVLQPGSESDPESQNRRAAFVGGLQKFGWTEGANVSIHYRWATIHHAATWTSAVISPERRVEVLMP